MAASMEKTVFREIDQEFVDGILPCRDPDADKNVLTDFTGNSESVVEVHNRAMLKAFIRFVSVTSSQVNSKSSGVEDTTKQEKVISQVKNFVDTQNVEDVDLDEFN